MQEADCKDEDGVPDIATCFLTFEVIQNSQVLSENFLFDSLDNVQASGIRIIAVSKADCPLECNSHGSRISCIKQECHLVSQYVEQYTVSLQTDHPAFFVNLEAIGKSKNDIVFIIINSTYFFFQGISGRFSRNGFIMRGLEESVEFFSRVKINVDILERSLELTTLN